MGDLVELDRGPFAGYLVEFYDGTNENKVGTVFCEALGARLDAETGELMPGQQIIVPDAAAADLANARAANTMLSAKIVDSSAAEATIASLQAQIGAHEEAGKTIAKQLEDAKAENTKLTAENTKLKDDAKVAAQRIQEMSAKTTPPPTDSKGSN